MSASPQDELRQEFTNVVMSGSRNLQTTPTPESEEGTCSSQNSPVSLEETHASRRQKPRSTACQRCRGRKIKCSGGLPCSNCRRSHDEADCSYSADRRTIKVSKKYLDNIKTESQTLHKLKENAALQHALTPPESTADTTPVDRLHSLSDLLQGFEGFPMKEPPQFLNANASASPWLIGASSDVVFATRVRQAITGHGRDLCVNQLDFVAKDPVIEKPLGPCRWPSPSRARLLIRVALKYASSFYHIVRASQVLRGLEQALQNPQSCDLVLRTKLWALFAIGEVYYTRAPAKDYYPGMAFFLEASVNGRLICERLHIDAVEVQLLLSLYSMAVSRLHNAYISAGSALRLSMAMGLHLRIPESQLCDSAVREHWNRVWWTAYCFDRMWASRLGRPAGIRDEDIEAPFPSDPVLKLPPDDFGDSTYLIASIRLARLAMETKRSFTVYATKSHQDSVPQHIKGAMKNLYYWFHGLPSNLRLKPKEGHPVTDSITQKHNFLHLYFYQCAITISRPMLLHMLKNRMACPDEQSDRDSKDFPYIAPLAEACIKYAQHANRLLRESWTDGSFATFDYFYTQYLFSSAIILGISYLLDGETSKNDGDQFEVAAQLMHQLKECGNISAKQYCQHIDEIKAVISATQRTKVEEPNWDVVFEAVSILSQVDTNDLVHDMEKFVAKTETPVSDPMLTDISPHSSTIDPSIITHPIGSLGDHKDTQWLFSLKTSPNVANDLMDWSE